MPAQQKAAKLQRLPKKMSSCCPAKHALLAIPTLRVKNLYAAIPRASEAIRVRAFSGRSAEDATGADAVTVVDVRIAVDATGEVIVGGHVLSRAEAPREASAAPEPALRPAMAGINAAIKVEDTLRIDDHS